MNKLAEFGAEVRAASWATNVSKRFWATRAFRPRASPSSRHDAPATPSSSQVAEVGFEAAQAAAAASRGFRVSQQGDSAGAWAAGVGSAGFEQVDQGQRGFLPWAHVGIEGCAAAVPVEGAGSCQRSGWQRALPPVPVPSRAGQNCWVQHAAAGLAAAVGARRSRREQRRGGCWSRQVGAACPRM